jgi:ribonuclease HII
LVVSLSHEEELRDLGFKHIAGIDEVGRGPLAGPVIAAAVILPAGLFLPGVDDSKKLNLHKRERLYQEIVDKALAFGLGEADVETIDRLNIAQASLQAMRRAVEALPLCPDLLLVDGNRVIPGVKSKQKTIIGGDAKCFSIACASILAKVTRDRMMESYDIIYPGYGFSQNRGYGTLSHRKALKRLGPCEIHRRSFSLFGPQGTE